MKIYLLRHAETNLNKDNIIQGRKNPTLNRKGQRDANKVREDLKDLDIDLCISSPLIRSVQTAFTVIGDRSLLLKDDRLTERSYGDLEGTEKDDGFDRTLYYDIKKNIKTNNIEPINDVYKRVEDFLDYIKKEYPNKNILIVTHSCIIRCILNIINNTKDKTTNIDIGNCYFTEIDI